MFTNSGFTIELNMKLRGTLRRCEAAFTLLEVIVACAIFFMCAFAILELVTRGLSAARSIQQREPDAGLVLAPFSLTNRFDVGVESGDFEDLYPGIYPGYSWTREITQPYGDTNPLFQVTVTIVGTTGKRKTSESTVATLRFCPDCLNGGAFGRGSAFGR
jgi:hypothetical protein